MGKQFSRPYLEKTLHKNRAGGVAQGEGPEFSPSTKKRALWTSCFENFSSV
jgi:hypothetical protein